MEWNNTAQLLNLFYSHKLHIDEVCKTPEKPSGAMLNLCNDILCSLGSISIHDIIDCLKRDYSPFEIGTSDIPQFSDIERCAFRTPYLVLASGQKDISFTQMGFMLLRSPKKDEAYRKYGENQAKTAAQMGLCSISGTKINASYLGITYSRLTEEDQKRLLPKLILYVPIIQNYFIGGQKQQLIDSYFESVAESTKIRRGASVKTLIQIVEKQLEDEL